MLIKPSQNSFKSQANHLYNTLRVGIYDVRLEQFQLSNVDTEFERMDNTNDAFIKTTMRGKFIDDSTILFDEFSYNEISPDSGNDLLYVNNIRGEGIQSQQQSIINPFVDKSLIMNINELDKCGDLRIQSETFNSNDINFSHDIESYEDTLQMDYLNSLMNIDVGLNTGFESVPFKLDGYIDSSKTDGVWFNPNTIEYYDGLKERSLKEIEKYILSLNLVHTLLRDYCIKHNSHIKVFFQVGPGGVVYQTQLSKHPTIKRMNRFDSIGASRVMKTCSAVYGREYDNSEIVNELYTNMGSVQPILNIVDSDEKREYLGKGYSEKSYFQSIDPEQREGQL